ncbi:hypothetical protein MT391_11965 [Vibrio sp. 1-Bac 57]
MKKIITVALTLYSATLFAAFPDWKNNPREGLEDNLIVGVACEENMGDVALDSDLATMAARASLAASLENMVQKDIFNDKKSESKKIIMEGKNEKVTTITRVAGSNAKQVVNQLLKYTWVMNNEIVDYKGDDHTCVRVVAKMPKIEG